MYPHFFQINNFLEPVGMHSPPSIGGLIRRMYLDPIKMSDEEFAKKLEVDQEVVDSLLNKDTEISKEMAKKLSIVFETSVDFWINIGTCASIIDVENNKDITIKEKVIKMASLSCKWLMRHSTFCWALALFIEI